MAGPKAETPGARARALAVLRVRGTAQAVALLPAAVAVVLVAGGATGHIGGSGSGWRTVRWVAIGVAALTLAVAVAVGVVIARARPALSPTVPVPEETAPDLYRMVRDLADRLGVPPPSAIALTPDCDSWLEDRTHEERRARRVRRARARRRAEAGARDRRSALLGRLRLAPSRAPGLGLEVAVPPAPADAPDAPGPAGPVLVIGSPFLWWMRVAELRALLAPVVAGTGPAAHPDIAAARRFVRALDAAVALAATDPHPDPAAHAPEPDGPASGDLAAGDLDPRAPDPREAAPYAARPAHAPWPAEREREPYATGTVRVAEAAPPAHAPSAAPGQSADGDPRAHEPAAREPAAREPGAPGRAAARRVPLAAVGRAFRRPGLAFVGWVARLLLRACRDDAAEMERGVAAASAQRAQGVDYGLRIAAQEQVGLAYAGWDRLLTRVALPAWRMGRWPAQLDAGVVAALTELSRRDRLAEGFASRLGERPACDLLEEPGTVDEAISLLAARLFHGGPATPGPDWSPVDWGAYPEEVVDRKWRLEAARLHAALDTLPRPAGEPVPTGPGGGFDPGFEPDLGAEPTLDRVLDRLSTPGGAEHDPEAIAERLAARLTSELAREEAAQRRSAAAGGAPGLAASGQGVAGEPWLDSLAPLFPLQPPRTGRELLADHVTAMVCCAAMDTAGAAPGLDWLDGPALLVDGSRKTDLTAPVLSLTEDGDPDPLRAWLGGVGVRPDKPIRLV
ncbi:hypothetical protein OYE22_14515 [Streptomyces sp. 71268]|uniref:hypothetical protein n=1 Tax=Streptomyces sp. 71268 TaxID=3002640 RepID=UPI0023F9E335|nr:hypothetical protein [Streptomyces sp. 71268]WEV26276.1 hypothetical protein OYE22_14515 [Streptomyces sp. 71268]